MSDRVLVSPRLAELGIRHGFSTRLGGVSGPPYDSLNLGAAVGDDPAAVAENHRRLADEAGVAGFHQVSQVHGDRVVEVAAGTDREALKHVEADGLVTADAGVAVAVRTADCVPLIVADPRTGAVAALHAGWRGTLAGIAGAGVARMAALHGSDPRDLVVAVGPSIRACCYEVSPELADRFESTLGPETVRRAEARPHLDLVEANLRVLEGAGVGRGQVAVLDACTACRPDLFYSHRRDGPRTGRHLGFVVAFP